MTSEQARTRFAAARVARLATVSAAAEPHIVPITFALLDGATIVTAVDHKPKRTTALKRLANLAANPAATVLTDGYDEDWTRLWWARADGRGRVVDMHDRARAALAQRYPQYAQRPPSGPLIEIEVARWSGWAADAAGDDPAPGR